MKQFFLLLFSTAVSFFSVAQSADVIAAKEAADQKINFTAVKKIAATPVKNQAATGTCWSFSTTSLIESQSLKYNLGEFDLSEMFTVRNIYIEKAKNYVLRQGHAQFSEGGLGHDQVRALATYGAMPEAVYSGLKPGQGSHNHQKLITDLQQYLDVLLKRKPLPENWLKGFIDILDNSLGVPPQQFDYKGKSYTPQSFATEILKFNANDYVNITSFTHHPFYAPFIIEVPDNFSNGAYYNLPLDEMIQVTRDAINSGYSVMWDADVSNSGFMQDKGIAVHYDSSIKPMQKTKFKVAKEQVIKQNDGASDQQVASKPSIDNKSGAAKGFTNEAQWDTDIRQALFENLTTQNDHLMHITGIERSPDGKTYFRVKNSWGNTGPDKGYINVSESYFAINTISLIIPKAALSKTILEKLKIK